MEVILKRELTEAEKKELLSLKNEKLITKYRTYVDNEISKVYTDNNLTILKNLKIQQKLSLHMIKIGIVLKEKKDIQIAVIQMEF